MTAPNLRSVSPGSGPTGGGDLARLVGTGFGPRVAVRFGGAVAAVVALREEAGGSVADVRTPPCDPGPVDVEVVNLNAAGIPIPGESVVLVGGYRFARPALGSEADFTRVVRELLRVLKQRVVADVSATVSVDYDDTVVDGLNVIAMAKVPALVLSGPTLRSNRFYSANELAEDPVPGSTGAEFVRRRPPLTVDLAFTLTVTSHRTAELLNFMAAVATFLNRQRWLELPRDPSDLSRGSVRWEMDADGEFRTQLGGRDDIRTFSCGFVVRGFDVDEGLPLDRSRRVAELELETGPISGGAA